MNHLTTDEIIDFVSISILNSESLDLASRVNSHILQCTDCLKKVEAFQTVYDALIQMPSTNKQCDMNNATEFVQLLKGSISAPNVELEKKPEKAK